MTDLRYFLTGRCRLLRPHSTDRAGVVVSLNFGESLCNCGNVDGTQSLYLSSLCFSYLFGLFQQEIQHGLCGVDAAALVEGRQVGGRDEGL